MERQIDLVAKVGWRAACWLWRMQAKCVGSLATLGLHLLCQLAVVGAFAPCHPHSLLPLLLAPLPHICCALLPPPTQGEADKEAVVAHCLNEFKAKFALANLALNASIGDAVQVD